MPRPHCSLLPAVGRCTGQSGGKSQPAFKRYAWWLLPPMDKGRIRGPPTIVSTLFCNSVQMRNIPPREK